MTTNTTYEPTFTSESILRAFTRRAVTMYLNGGGGSSTFLRLDGLAEGLTLLEIVMTPFAFIDIFQAAIVRSGGVPALTSSGRADWIESIVDAVTAEIL